jgi:DNA modification methylase
MGADTIRDRIIAADARNAIQEVPTESIHLTVTSPPYNLGVEYGEEIDDQKTIQEWTALIKRIVEETYRATVPDGKLCVVIGASFDKSDSDNRYKRVSLRRRVVEQALSVGFDFLDEVIWHKHQFSTHGHKALLGSYPDPPNLPITQQHEFILIFRKPLPNPNEKRPDIPPTESERRERSKLRREDWRKWTKSLWRIESDNENTGHRASFSVEVPRRLIRLYTFAGDMVFDPFLGTGTTAVAARRTGRHYFGIEKEPERASTARDRVEGVAKNIEQTEQSPTSPPDQIPDYILDGVDRQDPSTLRAIADYASQVAREQERVSLADIEETIRQGESIVDVARNGEGTIVEKLIPCGKNCSGCPHGPYRYRIFRDDGTLRTDYLGQVSKT